MRKIWIAAAAAATLFATAGAAYATGGIAILVDGTKVDAGSVKIENGTTLVPLRVIAEALNRDVQWDPNTQTVTIRPKENPSAIERLVIQRDRDIFVTDHPESPDGDPADQALISNLQTLYNEAYRGFLSADGEEPETMTEKELSFLPNSLATAEGSVATGYTFVRLVQPSYVPQTGENAPPSKDLLFYPDLRNPEDLDLGVQNPAKPEEWKVYRLPDYGGWFEKELALYLRDTRGLVY